LIDDNNPDDNISMAYFNYDEDESELVHFEAGQETTTVPTTNQNV